MSEPRTDRVATVHDSLVALLRDMPHADMLRIICPIIELDPSTIARVVHFDSTIELLSHRGLRRVWSFTADLVLDLYTHDGKRIRVVILEVQLSLDAGKLDSWTLMQPAFGIEAKVGTDRSHLLVVSPDPQLRATLRRRLRARKNPWLQFIERDHLEPITDYTIGRSHPHETILSALFHSREPDEVVPIEQKIAVLKAAHIALSDMSDRDFARYTIMIKAIVPEQLLSRTWQELEEDPEAQSRPEDFVSDTELTGYTYTVAHRKGREEGRAEGVKEGRAEFLVMLRRRLSRALESRGFTLPAELAGLLEACEDWELLLELLLGTQSERLSIHELRRALAERASE